MKYVCSICGYVYDEAEQDVPFDELPDDWKCPLCGAAKSDFVPQAETPEVKSEAPAPAAETPLHSDTDLQKLSFGQMSALCSNLARGCEKQYMAEESGLFKQLADYFAKLSPAPKDDSVEAIAKRLEDEIAYYSEMKSTAQTGNDRGAQRICVWGEKVTRMLSSLVNRYLKEGDRLLDGSEIWLCTVCGFIYIGKEAPQICPVCKVPAWKFEKINGR